MAQKKDKNDWIYLLLLILFFILKNFPSIIGVIPVKKKDETPPPKTPPGKPETSVNTTPLVVPKYDVTTYPVINTKPFLSPTPKNYVDTRSIMDKLINTVKKPGVTPVPTAIAMWHVHYDPFDIIGALQRGWDKQSPAAQVAIGAAVAAPVAIGAFIASPVIAAVASTGAVASVLSSVTATAQAPLTVSKPHSSPSVTPKVIAQLPVAVKVPAAVVNPTPLVTKTPFQQILKPW